MMYLCLLLALLAVVYACPFAKLLNKDGRKDLLSAAAKAAHAKAGVQVGKRAVEQEVEQEFVLRSRLKTESSVVFNLGFPVGYSVDNVETPVIEVVAGRTYKFTVLSACNHPFYLTTDSRGKGRAQMNTGFAEPPAQANPPICQGNSVLWTPTEDLVGVDIYYQCTIHDNMGNLVRVRKETLCEKYTNALSATFADSNALLTEIVTQTFDKLIDASPDNVLLEYFDGTIPAGSVDYTSDGDAAVDLANGLVQFFGEALDCRDGSIPPYAGPSMGAVHQNMPISKFEYDAFNTALLDVLENAGVEQADLDAVLALLNSNEVRGVICNVDPQCIETICTKYSNIAFPDDPLGNKKLLEAVVGDTVARVFADPKLAPFFNGEVPAGSTDFIGNMGQQTVLGNSLVSFFGKPGVLTCTQPTFPQNDDYAIADLAETHALMPIDTEIFNLFNDKVIEAAAALNVSQADQDAIRAVLDSTEPLICNQPGCSTVPVADQQFSVGVKTKANGHHFANQGFPAAFQLDGEDVGGLILEAGKTYQFKVNSGCLHPFYISVGTGAGSDDFAGAAGQISPEGEAICNGKLLTFKPSADDIGKEIFYACRNHNFMGGKICVVNEGDVDSTVCNAQPTGDVKKTFCDELTDNVLAQVAGTGSALENSKDVIEQVVLQAVTAGLGEPSIAQYFNGVKPPGSTDFTMSQSDLDSLVDKLVVFFGGLLGCSDQSIEDELDDVEVQNNMKTLHQFMDIQRAEFDGFNAAVVAALRDVDGSGAGLSEESANKVHGVLNFTATDICAGCEEYEAPSFCEKWSTALGANQVSLIEGAVVATFTKIVGPQGNSANFFDGTIPCESRDFVGNQLNQGNLVRNLIAFFGQPSILGCTSSQFPKYTGESDMELVHQNMPITKAVFDEFNNALLGYLRDNLKPEDVPSIEADLAKLEEALTGPAFSVICNQPDCDAPRGTFKAKVCETPAPTPAPTPGSDSSETPAPAPSTDDTDATPDTEDTEPDTEETEDVDSNPMVDTPVGAATASSLSLAVAALVALLAF